MSSKSNNNPERNLIFSTIDPQGRVVTLTTATWDHIKEHPEIKRAGLQTVKKTVVDPFYIVYNEPRSSLIYTNYTNSGLFINVIAKTDNDLTGASISTSHLTQKILKGEVIWHKPQKQKKKRKKLK